MSRSPATAQSTATAAPAADAASATRNWGSPVPGAARSITRRTWSSDRGGPAGARASAARASGCSSTSRTGSPDSCWHHDDHVTRPGRPGQAAPNGPKSQTKPIVTTRILSVILAERPDLALHEVVQTASNCPGGLRGRRRGPEPDCGHTPPGQGPGGARGDYEHAVKLVGGLIRYAIDALVADGDTVAAAWTGTLPSGDEMRGLSLYQVSGGLLRWTRHALIGNRPPTG